jgi:uncharacterized surface protein with fasciclin (FAS1) repeats
MKNKLVLMMFVLYLMTSAIAQTDATGTATDDATQARLRVNYCVFGGPNVDIYLNGEVAIVNGRAQTNMPPLAVWGYWHLEPGTYSVGVVPDPAGRGFDRTFMPPVDVTLEAGHRYTLVVLGQADEPSHEALLINETEAYEAIGATPTDNVHITINNLRGIAGITWKIGGEVREDDVPPGEFRAALWLKGPFTGFETIFRHAGSDELDSGAIDDEFWTWPGVEWQDCYGGSPSKASVFETEGDDWLNQTSNYASTLSAPELLREVGSTERSPYSFDTFLSAVEAAGLSEALTTGGPYLLYVPTDEAFAALPQDQRDALMADPEALADVARYHISEGYYPIGSFRNSDNPRRVDLTNLLGMDLVRRADGTINGVAVRHVETALVSNGTRLIVIGQVLQPPEQ